MVTFKFKWETLSLAGIRTHDSQVAVNEAAGIPMGQLALSSIVKCVTEIIYSIIQV